jgi:multidrug efflux pump
MHISAPFIKRPVGTMLLTVAVLIAGAIAYRFLPVAALPDVDFPTIQVSAGLPGASPETMASSVATPLERQFGRIAGVTQMTSTSMLGSTNISLQFDLDRNIDAAARDVQAAINSAAGQLPSGLPALPNYRKVNPADSPILILSLASDTMPVSRLYDIADSILSQKISQVHGVGQVTIGGGSRPAVRIELNPTVLAHYGLGLEDVRTVLGQYNSNLPKGVVANGGTRWVLNDNSQLFKAIDYRPLLIAYRKGAPVRLGDIADVEDSVENLYVAGISNTKPCVIIYINRQPGANIVATVDQLLAMLPELRSDIPPSM